MSEHVGRSRSFRVARAGFVGLLVALAVTWLWIVVLGSQRFWEGSTPDLHGVSAWQPLPAPATFDGPVFPLLSRPAEPREVVTVGYLGLACTASPWSIDAEYFPDRVVVRVDPDPRGCRNGERLLRAFQLTLHEDPGHRPVTVECHRSAFCTDSGM